MSKLKYPFYVIYKYRHIVVTQSRSKKTGNNYYTVVNLLKNIHCHTNSFKTAVTVARFAGKGVLPTKRKFLRNAVRRVM